MKEVLPPMPVVLATTRGTVNALGKEMTRDNIITLAWHTPLSFSPELYGICVGKTRFSCRLLQESKVFAVNFVPYEFKGKAMFCGTNSGMNTDKFAKCGLTREDCDTIECSRIGEASAVLECEVIDQVETGDHILFIGKVLKTINKDDKKALFHVEGDVFTTTL